MITLISVPNKFMAAHNQIAYTISSDNTSESNFNFVVDVNELAGSSNPIARLVYPKQVGTDQINLDIGSVLKNYTQCDALNVFALNYDPNMNSRVRYYCEFRELYDVSGIPTLSSVLISDPTTPSGVDFKVAGNAIFDFEEFFPNAYIDSRVDASGFLNYDLSIPETINLDQHRILTLLDPNQVATNIEVNISGCSTLIVGISYLLDEWLYNINAGKFIFDQLTGTPDPSGTITIRVLDSGDNTLALKTYTYPEPCSQYEIVRIHWLNKLGGFEAFNFTKSSKHSIDINRVQFKSPLQIGYATSDRLKTNYNTTVIDKINVNSDWISDELSEYFEQLLTSPAIYLERSATDLVAINITNTNYQVRKFMDNRQMFNLSFDIEYSYNRYRQTL